MLPIRFDDINCADILRLVEEKTSERKTLEYKARLNIETGDDKAEFLADISSFANAAGGDIVFGISDERDEAGKATGVPSDIVQLSISNPETERGRISQLIETGIQPRIPGVQVKVVFIPEKGPVIVIRVPKSWIAPHMVTYANRTRFFSRNNIIGKLQLDVQQIGSAFAQQRGLGERLRAWKTERISKAISGEGPVILQGSQILFHFISAVALTEGEQSLPRIFDIEHLMRKHRLFYMSAQSARYNADGLLMLSGQTHDMGQSYLQIFRDGSLEYADSAVLNGNGGDGVIASQLFEDKIMKTFGNALALLQDIETAEPIFVSLTLIGMKGRTMALPRYDFSGYRSHPFDRGIIVCPDMRVENLTEGYPYPSTLLPIVDTVWQAAGLERTPYSEKLWKSNQTTIRT